MKLWYRGYLVDAPTLVALTLHKKLSRIEHERYTTKALKSCSSNGFEK